MNNNESKQGVSNNQDLHSSTEDEVQITKDELSKLSYRQKFVVTEYGYLLSAEDAEQLGSMLGNLVDENDILSFCQAKGKKVFGHDQNAKIHKSSPQNQAKVFGMFGAFIGAIPISILKLIVLLNDNLHPLCTPLTDDFGDIVLTTCGILMPPFGYLYWIYFGFNLLGGALFGILGARIGQRFNSHRTLLWSFAAGILFDLLFVFYFLWPGY